MSNYVTAEEWKQEYREVMGPALGSFYGLLVDECYRLHYEWAEFKELFGTNPERIELLNQAAPAFFSNLQRTLWDVILLRIARLMDSPNSGGAKENITLRGLPGLLDPLIRIKVEDPLKAAQEKCAFSLDWRNRRIAHNDLQLAMEKAQNPLSPASRATVGIALDSIAAVLNPIESHYFDSRTVAYSWANSILGAKVLLHTLQEGIDAQTERGRGIRPQNRPPEDN